MSNTPPRFLIRLGQLAIAACLCAGVASARDPQGIRTLNNEALRLNEEARTASSRTGTELRSRAASVIQQRSAELSALAAEDPALALSLALPPDVVANLKSRYPDAADSLETEGTWEGPAEQWVEDYQDGTSRRLTRMKVGDETLDVHFAGAEPVSCGTTETLSVTGIRIGNRLAVSRGEVRLAAGATATATPSCSATGVQNVVVLMATFPGITPPATITRQGLHDTFFGATGHSLDGYWREASYGQTSATGDVYGWYTLSQAYTCSTLDQAVGEAMNLASSAGATFQNGTRVVLIYPKIGCVAGFAQVGCSTLSTPSGTINGSISYVQADYMSGDQGVYFAIHEVGHNLGLQHAGTLSGGTETLGPLTSPGTIDEYNDNFSSMGSQTLGQYSAQHKAEVLGWMSNGPNYQVVQSSGIWTLQPFETTPAGLQALKVQRGTGNDAWLWIEYRRPQGTYDSTLYFQQPSGGAFIHYADPTVGAFTHLLNFQPQTASWYAPALLAGQTWVDPYTNVSVSVLSASSTAMTVSVTYGASACTRANPTISLSPLNPSAIPGTAVTYTLTLTNNDSAGCADNTFSMGSSLPTGWPTSFSPASLTLAPGRSGSITMSKTPPAGIATGMYAVDATATAGSMAGSGLATVTVTASRLSVNVTAPSSTYSAGQTVPLTAAVSYNGALTGGATVTFTLTQPNGGKSTKTVTANSTGNAVWNYKIGPKGPRGAYSVTAVATYNSQTVTSAAATFTVQ